MPLREIPFDSFRLRRQLLRAGSSLRLKSGFAQDDAREIELRHYSQPLSIASHHPVEHNLNRAGVSGGRVQ
jgi:hypothetical protein